MRCQFAVLIVLLTLAASSSAAPCFRYGVPVTLSGAVVLKTFFGPPNYGENPESDARETQGLLELATPVCVDKSSNVEDEREVNQQLVTLVPMNDMNLKHYAGLNVTIRGSLFHAITGHNHTVLLLEMTSIAEKR